MKRVVLFFLIIQIPVILNFSGSSYGNTPPDNENYSISINSNGNNSYVINLTLPRASFVKLIIKDENNKTVKILLNENLKSGTYELALNGNELKQGRYKINFRARDYFETKYITIN